MTRAPCGCPGEHVIGNYVRCKGGCEGPREPDDDRITKELCVHPSGYQYNGKWYCSGCDELLEKPRPWW